ncbi:MAG: hypothetical protein WBD36_13165 [Bacteroidota bacterium]
MPKLISLYRKKDLLWLTIWVTGMGFVWLWDVIFLNTPALVRIQSAFLNSLLTGSVVVAFSLAAGWILGVGLDMLEHSESSRTYALTSLAVNALRSVPQIIVLLVGYVLLTVFLHEEIIQSTFVQLLWIALATTLAVFLEVADTVRSRIEYFRTLDFVDAMLCCGVSEIRIMNVEILWKNSKSHLLHKLIGIFGVSIFLQCSIDFIISVGLSTDVSLSNLPLTIGSLLATLDSKQDILALSNLFSDPGYLPAIFVRHLQGLSLAFFVVFTLLCMYNIANGFERRHKLA